MPPEEAAPVKLRFTERADRDYAGLSVEVRQAFAKQLGFLLANLRHPSLHAKKYDEEFDLAGSRHAKLAILFQSHTQSELRL
jgi:hypothetical protein